MPPKEVQSFTPFLEVSGRREIGLEPEVSLCSGLSGSYENQDLELE